MGVFFLNWLSTLQGPTKNLVLRVILFILYLLAGAAIFQALESKYGTEEKRRFDHVKYWLRETYGMNDSVLSKIVREVTLANDEGYFDIDYDRWSFMGSLFFAATVVTTIGYGHLSPRTFGGRLFCIFYAFFGIPLAGLMLKSLGERMMDGIDLCIRAIDRNILKRDGRPTNVRTSITLFSMMLIMILLLAVVAVRYEGWTYFESAYFAFITLSTIGFGDYVPTQPSEKLGHYQGFQYHVALFILVTFVYITVGLAVVSSTLLSVTRLFETKTEWEFISLRNEEDDDEEIIIAGDEDKNANMKSEEKFYLND